MCGLVGIFDRKGFDIPDRDLIVRMSDRLRHRGPDGEGYLIGPGVALGHRRLSIIDPGRGAQPLYNEDGSVAVVFNGCIYNFRAIRTVLQAAGHVFKTDCDTEVIVHAWEEWGKECVTRFRGMFAFAIWDATQETLFLARDRLGKKPLYYSELPTGRIVFGSELKALLVDPEVSRDIDSYAVDDFFAYGYIPDPRTIYRSVAKLPPAHTLLVRRGSRPHLTRYWDLAFVPQPISEADACEGLIEHLRDAVSVRLVSDVPLGAFLSGGVDSSAVVATMSSLSREPVSCFSVEFGVRGFDETAYARTVAKRFHASHVVDNVDPDDLMSIDGLISTYDEPFGDSSALPTSRVCAVARRQVKVALSGDGGDEQFAGYRRYKWHVAEERVRGLLPTAFRQRLFAGLADIYPELGWAPRVFRAKHTFQELAQSPPDAFFHSVAVTSDAMRRRLYSESFMRELQGYDPKALIRKHMANANSDDPLSQALYADFNTWLPGDILTKLDRASMANSLEVRAPFLDHQFVEWSATLPAELKLQNRVGKYVLKRALEPILPREILYRPKQGFSMPMGRWFRGPLRAKVRRSVALLRESRYFNGSELDRIVDDHEKGRRDHSAVLWLLLVFESFLRASLAAGDAVPDNNGLGSKLQKAV